MKRKLLFMLMALLMTATAWADLGDIFIEDGIKYQIISEDPNMVEVLGRESEPIGNLTIPESVNGYTVTCIGHLSFCDAENLESVIIPATVKSIDLLAFAGCTKLSSVNFANGSQLTVIASEAFDGCESLTSITIPDGVTSIGEFAFAHCKGLTSITIPNGVISIGLYAFIGCTNITDVYCFADPSLLTWDIRNTNEEAYDFKAEKATLCHVAEVSTWTEKFPNINVTFVDDLDTGIKDITTPSFSHDKEAFYDLTGRLINENNLFPGIYVRQGKKMIVK